MLIESEIKTATLGLADFRPIDKKSKKGKKEIMGKKMKVVQQMAFGKI